MSSDLYKTAWLSLRSAASALLSASLSWTFAREARDGSRARTMSLGIYTARACHWHDLRGDVSVSDRERPLFLGVNDAQNGPAATGDRPSDRRFSGRCRRLLVLAIDCCCCCHRCYQRQPE
jgi:hypothetical protein